MKENINIDFEKIDKAIAELKALHGNRRKITIYAEYQLWKPLENSGKVTRVTKDEYYQRGHLLFLFRYGKIDVILDSYMDNNRISVGMDNNDFTHFIKFKV